MAARSSDEQLRAARQDAVGRFLARPRLTGPVLLSALTTERRARPSEPAPGVSGNLVGVGLGDKIVGGRSTGQLAVKLYVRQKKPLAEVPPSERLPTHIDGVPTDVEEVGVIRALGECTTFRRQYVRPVPGGYSVGHGHVTAGTLGALVRDSGRADNGRRYVLSNNHVLADARGGTPGDPIYQPGPVDGGMRPEHRLGRLSRLVRLDLAGGMNAVDAAIAEVEPGSVLAEICSIGTPRRTARPERGTTVRKHGRTTGLTRGEITDVDADFVVELGGRTALFAGAVVIRGTPPTVPFSDAGDSGALVVYEDRRACGLLFAGSPAADVTLANPIRAVFRRLRIRLAPPD